MAMKLSDGNPVLRRKLEELLKPKYTSSEEEVEEETENDSSDENAERRQRSRKMVNVRSLPWLSEEAKRLKNSLDSAYLKNAQPNTLTRLRKVSGRKVISKRPLPPGCPAWMIREGYVPADN